MGRPRIDPRACNEDGEVLSPRQLAARDGMLAWPSRFPPERVKGFEYELGQYAFAGQYQQSPTPRKAGYLQTGVLAALRPRQRQQVARLRFHPGIGRPGLHREGGERSDGSLSWVCLLAPGSFVNSLHRNQPWTVDVSLPGHRPSWWKTRSVHSNQSPFGSPESVSWAAVPRRSVRS
jgi:hypothetical protein